MSQIITKGLLSAKLLMKGFFGKIGVPVTPIDCKLIGTVTEFDPVGILTELDPYGTLKECLT